MTDFGINADQISYLAGAVCNRNASEDDLILLDSILHSDPESRSRYVDYCWVHVALRLQLRAQRGVSRAYQQVNINPVGTPLSDLNTLSVGGAPSGNSLFADLWRSTFPYLSSGWPVAYLIATVIFGIGALVGSFTYVLRPVQVAERLSIAAKNHVVAEQQKECVGRITGMINCKWSKKHPISHNVTLGEIFHLTSGLLEITYDSGAKIILQGPVTYEASMVNGGYLSIGKLTARLEQKAVRTGVWQGTNGHRSPDSAPPPPIIVSTSEKPRFTINTPSAVIVDIGTEFSVNVEHSGATLTYVHEGHVRVAGLCRNSRIGEWQDLNQGEAVRAIPNGPAVCITNINSEEFVRQMPIQGRIIDNFNLPYDYLREGPSGTIWSGILNADKASRIDTYPLEIDGACYRGCLHIAVPHGAFVGWETPKRPGLSKGSPYLYVDVPKGNFSAQVQVKRQTICEFSVAGLMARLDDNNFVMSSCYMFSPQDRFFAARSEKEGVDSCGSEPITTPDGDFGLRLVRLGNTFIAYGSTDGGQIWRTMPWLDGGYTLLRPDMIGPLQVGLWYGTFNPDAGDASFDNFSIKVGSPQ